MILDIFSIALAIIATLAITYGIGKTPGNMVHNVLSFSPFILLLTLVINELLGLHTSVWEYASLPEFLNIVIANVCVNLFAFALQGILNIKLPNKFLLLHCIFMIVVTLVMRHSYRVYRRVIRGVDYSNKRKFKDEEYIKEYCDINGNITKRKFWKQVRVKCFAVFKYAFDRLFSILGLIIASPVMIIIAIAIKLDDGGPVFFKQERTGKGGTIFNLRKFRTMSVDNDVHNFSKADQHTRVGKFLRKTSLDELPQLFAIASGKMSFIGPRPWIPDYYINMNKVQRQRYIVRPGLTGLAQAKGRNNISIFKKISYDLVYIQNYSLVQDILIIFWTIQSVFSGKGADAGKNTIKKEIDDLKHQEPLQTLVKEKAF